VDTLHKRDFRISFVDHGELLDLAVLSFIQGKLRLGL
jgi:hypothetical protein